MLKTLQVRVCTNPPDVLSSVNKLIPLFRGPVFLKKSKPSLRGEGINTQTQNVQKILVNFSKYTKSYIFFNSKSRTHMRSMFIVWHPVRQQGLRSDNVTIPIPRARGSFLKIKSSGFLRQFFDRRTILKQYTTITVCLPDLTAPNTLWSSFPICIWLSSVHKASLTKWKKTMIK